MSLIAISDLTKRFPGVTALDSLSVEIEPGIVGLVGANGAGKSTLIKILLGLLPPTSGGAEVLGMDSRRDGIRIRAAVGYMPEHDCLPPDLTATDFVAHMGRMSGIPSDGARERTADVLRHCGLYEERYRQIGTYSTGMKQRVKLAQALVHDPRILFLDEPTNGLDPAGREEMLDLIRRTGTEFGITVVVSSHLLGEIERVCDFLVAIDAGRLLRAAPLASFTQLTDLLAIEVEDRHAELAALLASRGLTAEVDGSLVLVRMTAGVGDGPYDIVRDAVVDLGLPLIRMEQGRHSLEDLFRAEETDAGIAGGEFMPPPTAPGGPGAAIGPMTGGPA
jgi:ABC-2 type transport system ATP-binding protein